MQIFLVGEYIKQRRKQLKLTQEKVCGGICDQTTLSRIENGHQAPSKTVINALLQRLGLPDEKYYAMSSKNDLEIEALKKEIMGCNIVEDYNRISVLMERLKSIVDSDDTITHQFILRSEALIKKGTIPCSLQQQLALLTEAIHLTIPEFSLNQINDFLYTFDEIKILNQIALVYSDMGNHETALELYKNLLDYIYSHYMEIICGSGLLHLILHNYTRELNLLQRYSESISSSEKGKDLCIQYANYQFLPGFLALAAESYHFCGNDEKSGEYYKQAFYLYQALNDIATREFVRKEAYEYLQLTF